MLGKGSDEKQHKAAPDVTATVAGRSLEPQEHWRVETGLGEEGMGEDGSVTRAVPLERAPAILSPNRKEGNHSFSALQTLSHLFQGGAPLSVHSLWDLLRLLPGH